MAGLVFTISLVSILATVGFLFAWMVRLASIPGSQEQQNDPETLSKDFPQDRFPPKS